MTAVAVRRRVALLVLAAALFVALTIAAMVAYNGGSRFDVGSRHYLFFGNFFSDLGVTVTYSGRANTVPHALFVIALVALGAAFAWSGPAWKTWAVGKEARLAATVAGTVPVLSGLGFVGIAVTPRNRVNDVHIVLVQAAFGLLLLFVASLVVVQIRNDMAQPWIGANVAFLVLLAAYVVVVFGGPTVDTLAGLRTQIVAQKLIVYTAVVNLSFQAWGVRRQLVADSG